MSRHSTTLLAPRERKGGETRVANETIRMNPIRGLRYHSGGSVAIFGEEDRQAVSRGDPAIKTGVNIFFFGIREFTTGPSRASTPTRLLVALIAWRNARFDPEGGNQKEKTKKIGDERRFSDRV